MKRNTILSIFAAVALATSLAVQRPAAGQDPGDLAGMRAAADSYAAGLSGCNVSALGACTSAPFHERLRARLTPCSSGQLGAFRRTQHETTLDTDVVEVTLLWTQPDGVLKTLPVVVKKDAGGRWVVAGGAVP